MNTLYSVNLMRLVSYAFPLETGCYVVAQQVGWENKRGDLNWLPLAKHKHAAWKDTNLISLFAWNLD